MNYTPQEGRISDARGPRRAGEQVTSRNKAQKKATDIKIFAVLPDASLSRPSLVIVPPLHPWRAGLAFGTPGFTGSYVHGYA